MANFISKPKYLQAVNLLKEGKSQRETSKIVGIANETVRRIYKDLESKGALPPKRIGGYWEHKNNMRMTDCEHYQECLDSAARANTSMSGCNINCRRYKKKGEEERCEHGLIRDQCSICNKSKITVRKTENPKKKRGRPRKKTEEGPRAPRHSQNVYDLTYKGRSVIEIFRETLKEAKALARVLIILGYRDQIQGDIDGFLQNCKDE